MRKLIACVASAALVLILPLIVNAGWNRVQLADGTQACKDDDTGATFKPPYTTKTDVTKSCNTLTSFVPWLGTADAATIRTRTQQNSDGSQRTAYPNDSAPAGGTALTSPWLQTDVGSPPVAGTASDNGTTLTTKGSGLIHKDTSAYHFVYQEKSGNWRIDFAESSLSGDDQYRYCGPFITDDLASDSKWAFVSPFFPTGQTFFAGRPTTGAGVYEDPGTLTSFAWASGYVLRLEIIGSVITGYISTNGGSSFTQIGSTNWTPSGTFFIGVASSSGAASTLATCIGPKATLTSLSSSTAGKVDFTAATQTVNENAGTAQICVTRSVDTSGSGTVQIQNAGTGTAVAGTDFTNIFPVTVGWSNGIGGSACATLTVANRSGTQGSRTLNLTLGSASGVSIGTTQTTQTITFVDVNPAGTKTAFGYWGLIQSCYHAGTGCTLSSVLSQISTEICQQQYVQGLAVLASWSMAEGDTAGDYTGDSTRGFVFWDQVRDALRACNKKLDVTFRLDESGDNPATVAPDFFPKYVVQSNYSASGTCAPDPGCPYGLVAAPGGGSIARGWVSGVKDRQIAAMQAYCARYETDSTWVGLSFNYDSNGALNNADQYNLVQNMIAIDTATRAACPTMNIRFGITYWAGGSTANTVGDQIRATLVANDSDIRGTDVLLAASVGAANTMTWADLFYYGYRFDSNGNPTTVGAGSSLRGVQRKSEEVEGADMCERWQQTPANIMDFLVNGGNGYPARLPGRVVISMLNYCDPTYGWSSWKSLINSTQGKLYNGRDTTPRTPAELNSTWCESGMQCP